MSSSKVQTFVGKFGNSKYHVIPLINSNNYNRPPNLDTLEVLLCALVFTLRNCVYALYTYNMYSISLSFEFKKEKIMRCTYIVYAHDYRTKIVFLVYIYFLFYKYFSNSWELVMFRARD